MKRKNKKKKSNGKNIRKVFFDKVEILAIILFIFSLFLLDVNLNMIAVYGLDITSPFVDGVRIHATSLFWFGFIIMSISLFLICIRSLYRKVKLRSFDIFFGILGILSWGIVLSGGLLLFIGGDNFIIPFFSWDVHRINYYHFGIGLSVITTLYFALTHK